MTDLTKDIADTQSAWEQLQKMTAIRELAGAMSPPESQFSLNWMMLDQFGGNVQCTMRAAFLSEWPTIMGTRKEFCLKAQEAGWTFPGGVKPAPSLTPPPATAPAPVAAPTTVPAATAPTNGHVLVINSVRMDVVPKADGKAELQFFEAGHKYADLYITRKLPELLTLIAKTGDWTLAHLQAASSYQTAMLVEYTLSDKLNQKGKPYKDVQAVKPA